MEETNGYASELQEKMAPGDSKVGANHRQRNVLVPDGSSSDGSHQKKHPSGITGAPTPYCRPLSLQRCFHRTAFSSFCPLTRNRFVHLLGMH